jgi:hypothetical protein
MPEMTISTGKYQSALYIMPAVAAKKTTTRVILSVMAFCDSSTAARAMTPTVAELSPDSKA